MPGEGSEISTTVGSAKICDSNLERERARSPSNKTISTKPCGRRNFNQNGNQSLSDRLDVHSDGF